MASRYVVLGGGVSGVCCAEEILRLQPAASVTLITPDEALKGVSNIVQITKHTEEFQVVDLPAQDFQGSKLQVVKGSAADLDLEAKTVLLNSGDRVAYDRLCICTGASPRVVADSEHVLMLRDQDTIADLQARLQSCRRVMLFGNGGIALEVVHALRGIEVVWAVKQGHLGDAFFDLDAAAFLLTELQADIGSNLSYSQSSPPRPPSPIMAAAGSLSTSQHPAQSTSTSAPAITRQLSRESPVVTVHPGSGHSPPSSLPASAPALSPFEGPANEEGSQPSRGVPIKRPPAPKLAMGRSSSGNGSLPMSNLSWPAGSPATPAQRIARSGKSLEERCQHGSSSAALERLMEASSSSQPSSFTMVQGRKNGTYGHAVGPKWTEAIAVHAANGGDLVLERNCEYERLVSPREAEQQGEFDGRQWPVYVRLTNGKTYGVDLVISAIGVLPNAQFLPKEVVRDEDVNGILVDRYMRSSAPDVWAAGDCCTVRWPDRAQHWFQMRLWTQARLMGLYAANCMAGDPEEAAFGFNFELFTHATRFLGRRVILLGLYNGQGLDDEPDSDIVTYCRATDGPDAIFVRVLLLRNRMMGAVLIGNTDYEEVFENLILDGLDLSGFGPDLLSEDIDLDQVFD